MILILHHYIMVIYIAQFIKQILSLIIPRASILHGMKKTD